MSMNDLLRESQQAAKLLFGAPIEFSASQMPDESCKVSLRSKDGSGSKVLRGEGASIEEALGDLHQRTQEQIAMRIRMTRNLLEFEGERLRLLEALQTQNHTVVP